MSFPRYPAYKPSGVEWLGEVPEHWEVLPLKRRSRLLTDKTDRRDNPVALENIEGWTGRFVDTDSEFQGEGVAFGPGDILFGKLRPYLAKVYLADNGGQAVGDFHIIHPLASLHPRFLQFFLLTRESIDLINGSTFGAKMPRASWDFLGSLQLSIPPLNEQIAIATFLDRETAKIVALIAEQQRLIELLQEKRQAVISHAVTKGLNPDAPMKDSGVEWLGEVPEHWDVCSMRRVLLKIEQGWSPECLASPAEEGEWGVVKAGCVNGGAFNQLDNKTLPHHLEPPFEYEIQAGDLLMSRASGSPDLIGSAAFIEHVRPRLLLSDKTFRLRTAQRVYPRYLSDVLGSTPLRQQIRRSISGAVGLANNLPQSEIKDLIIPLPPTQEQREIHKLLTRENGDLDILLNESESLISLLQERRSALISAAVTGQIDVRGLAPEAA